MPIPVVHGGGVVQRWWGISAESNSGGESVHAVEFRPFRSGSGGGVRPYGQPAMLEPTFFKDLMKSASWRSVEHAIPPKIQQLVKNNSMRTDGFGGLPRTKVKYIVSRLFGGLNNQVLELMNLVAIARRLGAIVVLPEWSLTYNYFAKDFGKSKDSVATNLRFSQLFNMTSFKEALLSFGIQAVSTLPTHLAKQVHKQFPIYPKPQLNEALDRYRTHLQSFPVLHVACTQQNYLWDSPDAGRLRAGMLQGLEGARQVQAVASRFIPIMRQKTGHYTALKWVLSAGLTCLLQQRFVMPYHTWLSQQQADSHMQQLVQLLFAPFMLLH